MRVLILWVAIMLGNTPLMAADDADAGAAKAAACSACHNAMVSLKGRGVGTIVQQTKAIRSGEKEHPPGLAELSDEDIAAIAEHLDGAE